MKTYAQFLEEALASFALKAGLRHLAKSGAVKKAVAKAAPQITPKTLSMTKLYHGTTAPASKAISRTGWSDTLNVTRQMAGKGVYATPQKATAQSYALQRSAQRGEAPAVRTMRVPTSSIQTKFAAKKDFGEFGGKQSFDVASIKPELATKYDITGKGIVDLNKAQKKELAQAVKDQLKAQKAALKPPKPTKPPKSRSGYEYGQEGRVTAKDVDVFQTRQRTGGYGEPNATRGGKPGVGQTKTVATLTKGPFAGATPIRPESKRILQQYAKGTGVGQNPLRGEPGSGAELTPGMQRIKKQIVKRIEKKYQIGKPESGIAPSPRTPAAKDALRDIAAHEAEVAKKEAIKKKGFEDLAKEIENTPIPPSKPPTSTSASSAPKPNGKKKKKGSFVGDLATFGASAAVGGYAGGQEEEK